MTSVTGELKQSILLVMSDGEKRDIPEIKKKVKEKSGMEFDKDYRTSHISGALHQLLRNNRLQAYGSGIYQLKSASQRNEEKDNRTSSDEEMAKLEKIQEIPAVTLDEKKINDIRIKVDKIEEEILKSVKEQHDFVISRLEEVSMQEIFLSGEMDNMNRITELAKWLEKFRLINKRT